MGRRAEPAAIRAQKAAVRSTRRGPQSGAPELEESGLAAPAWLRGQALEIWRKRGPILREMRLLSAADEPAFARYCRNFAKWLDIRAQLDKRGYTYLAASTNGGKLRRADPAFLVADRLERQLLATEDRFGMSPSERQRIMAQRAAAPAGDLFPGRPDDPAAEPAQPAEPIETPIGALN